jgi:hypothetical protein
VALGDMLTNAGTIARDGTKGGGRRTAVPWCVRACVRLEYASTTVSRLSCPTKSGTLRL